MYKCRAAKYRSEPLSFTEPRMPGSHVIDCYHGNEACHVIDCYHGNAACHVILCHHGNASCHGVADDDVHYFFIHVILKVVSNEQQFSFAFSAPIFPSQDRVRVCRSRFCPVHNPGHLHLRNERRPARRVR